MALKDFLFKGSYTSITNVFYEKKDKRIQFTLSVFSDKEQTQPVNTMNYLLGVQEEMKGFSEADFDKFFGIKALEAKSNNIYAAIYRYLKTRDEYSKVKDA